MQFVSINEAATLTGKSVLTIRRMIKQKKIQAKRQRTAQGFAYLVFRHSLNNFLDLTNRSDSQTTSQPSLTTQPTSREHAGLERKAEEALRRELSQFNVTIQRLVEQHEKDKTNLFDLIKKFQDRIMALEANIKLLEAPKPRWWQFWR